MAKFDSAKSKFLITDTGAVERDLSANITALDGLPGPRELLDSTTLGATGHQFHPSLENVPFSIEGFYSDGIAPNPDVVLSGLRTHTSAVNFKYGPGGNVAAQVRYTGTCWVRNYQITTRIGSLVGYRAELQAEGAVTRDTF